MKCPKDFFEESLVNSQNLQKDKSVVAELEQQLAEAYAKRAKIQAQINQILGTIDLINNTRNTIAFCEKDIASMIEEAYQSNKDSVHVPICELENRYGRKVFRKLSLHSREYANGDDSYEPYGDYCDLAKFIEYLTQFCYKVTVREEHNWYKSYGRGYISTVSFVIQGIPCALEV